jgi:amino acid permease
VFKTEFTPVRFYLIGILVVTGCVVLAGAVESLEKVFGLVGGVTCNIVVYILPALYYIRLCSKGSKVKRFVAFAMIPIGVILIGVCLYEEIDSMGSNQKNDSH